MADIVYIRGLNAQFRFFLGNTGSEIILPAKSWSVKENSTKVTDPTGGEDRDRLDKVTNSFDLSIQSYLRYMTALDAWLDDIANNDAQVAPLAASGGIGCNVRDGTKKRYVMRELTRDDFSIDMGGRADAVMLSLNLRCRYFEAAKRVA